MTCSAVTLPEMAVKEYVDRVARCFGADELQAVTAKEFQHLALWLWSRLQVDCAAERAGIIAELEHHRSGLANDLNEST